MPKRSSINKSTTEALVRTLVNGLSKEADDEGLTEEVRHLIAVTLGRQGGLKGGKARAQKLSAKKRSAIAKKAAEARWGKTRPTK
jgi:hypothetical protein